MAFRIFVAGAEIQCAEAPAGTEEAMDIMLADSVPMDTAAKLAVAAGKTGRDPVAFAQHFVQVRREFRAGKQGR